ncbi:MAG: hypothetical protein AAFQ47_08065 [Pseudomonadota bacterium]
MQGPFAGVAAGITLASGGAGSAKPRMASDNAFRRVNIFWVQQIFRVSLTHVKDRTRRI